MGKHHGCFFCGEMEGTELVNYKFGTTGKRGRYRRRICQSCKVIHKDNIRGPYDKEVPTGLSDEDDEG